VSDLKRALQILGRVALALVLAVCMASDGLAQGRRKKKKKKKKPSKSYKKKTYPRGTIILARGRMLKDVQVRSLVFNKVEYRVKGSNRSDTIKGEKIVEIRYKSAPPDLSSGRSRIRAGLYKRAAVSFEKAIDESADGSWVWFYATYGRGQAKLLAGDAAGAVTDFEAVIAKQKDHFLVPNALYGLGKAHTANKSMGPAKAAYEKLADSRAWGTIWGAKAKLGLGDTLLAMKKPAEARAAYNLAGSRAGTNKDLRRAADVGEGKCMVMRKQYDQAVAKFEQIMQTKGLAAEVSAMAWVGKGDCRYQQGKSGGDKNLLKQALLSYQTAVVRFAGVPEYYPKALFRSAELYETLGQPKLAELQRKELKTRCPNSPWTSKLK
jgi:tetratricopeptide (TPR) repeat protein